MDENVEHEEEVVIENITEEDPSIKEEVKNAPETVNSQDYSEPEVKIDTSGEMTIVPTIQNVNTEDVVTKLSFNDIDKVLDEEDDIKSVTAPKAIEHLELLSTSRSLERKFDELDDDENFKITDTDISTSFLDIDNLDKEVVQNNEFKLNDVEELY